VIRAAAMLLLLAQPVAARDILLGLPVACDMAQTCFLQNYMDRDPGPGAADFTCAPQSYDGHDGVDFALPDEVMMAAGVDVLAAAPGTVKATRDGMADALQGVPGAPDITDQECGNGLVIDHGGGWETQYCHMKQGSVVVQPGLHVAMGQRLGQVGLSGQTEFPHLHLTVRHDGVAVDPFHPDDTLTCGTPPDHTLWLQPLPYGPGGMIAAGFATEVPEFAAIKAGLPSPAALPGTAPALVLWAELYGGRKGDSVTLTITSPTGPLLTEDIILVKPQARLFRAVGKRLTTQSWPPGTYIGTAIFTRDGKELDRQSARLTIGP